MLMRLVASPKALSEMERDFHGFLAERRMHGTVNLNIPPEIYTPLQTDFLESDAFHRRNYPLAAGDVNLGRVTIWSYRAPEASQTQELESYLYPWILGFRHRLMTEIGQGAAFFGRRYFTAPEVDFYKRRLWYEIERGKRYNVFLTYFSLKMDVSADIHEERLNDALRRILRPFEPSISFLETTRLDFLKIGHAVAAAERFVPEIEAALKQISCSSREIRRWTFPKDFFEYEEFLEKVEL